MFNHFLSANNTIWVRMQSVHNYFTRAKPVGKYCNKYINVLTLREQTTSVHVIQKHSG